MDIRIIHYFLSVYEEGSFTKAAERMHVVQPALSMQIRNLEEELGTVLFERNARGVAPTIAGRRFYELTLPIARNIAFAKQEILDLVQGDRVSGSLRIGLPPSVCLGVLGKVLTQFCCQYPNVDVEVVEAYSRMLTEQVHDGSLDVALGAMPTEQSSLACRHGFKDEFVLISGQPIHGESLTPCNLSAMKDLKLIIPSERHLVGSTMLDYVMSGQASPRQVMKIDGLIATLECARNSDWGALCPFVAVINELAAKTLYIYPIIGPVMPFDLYLVHHPRRPLTLAARRFVEILEKELDEVHTKRAQAFWRD
jgi:DNA-binding transcriptional LysR family regulator